MITVSIRAMPASPCADADVDRDCNVSVFSYADGTFTGNARLESEMNVREEGLRVNFKIGP